MLNREDAMNALENTYDVIQMIEPHMAKADLWSERAVNESWRILFGIPFVVLFFVVMKVFSPIIDFLMDINQLLGFAAIFFIGAIFIYLVVTTGTKICRNIAKKSFDIAFNIYSMYQSELNFLPGFEYCRAAAYNYMHSILETSRCNNLNEALALWDLEVKHNQMMHMQGKISDQLSDISDGVSEIRNRIIR